MHAPQVAARSQFPRRILILPSFPESKNSPNAPFKLLLRSASGLVLMQLTGLCLLIGPYGLHELSSWVSHVPAKAPARSVLLPTSVCVVVKAEAKAGEETLLSGNHAPSDGWQLQQKACVLFVGVF